MKTLICAPNATLNLSKRSPWEPRFPACHPTQNLNHPLSTLKPRASAKGFSTGPPGVGSDIDKKKPMRGKKTMMTSFRRQL
ncbi:hypothetical protein E2542_SST31552 [Spatholobus suberectus]|nr:hypothetical protein E2542_SST31552 [Spatholobus suberectus]